MSGRESDGARDMRAAEYVLGTLDAGERAAFELERAVDPATEAARRAWERRLGPLARAVPAVRPGPEVWARIAAALPSGGAGQGDGRDEPRGRIPGPAAADDDRLRILARQVRFWRRATVAAAGAAGLAAAGLALVLAGPVRPTPTGGRSVAVVTSGGDLPALIVSVDGASGTVRVRPLAARAPEGRSLELWYVGAGAAPRPLGLVGTEPSRLALPPEAGASPGATLAVSIEPPGGSPTGQPTGPVVYSGKLIPE